MSNKQDIVRNSDLERMRSDLRAEWAAHVDESAGEVIVGKLLGRLRERAAAAQQAEAIAVANRDEVDKQCRLFQERLVRVKSELAELSKERGDLQTAVDGLRAEYDGLLPKVQELRAEQQRHTPGARREAGGLTGRGLQWIHY